eukprot:gene10251-11953_t
MAEININVKKLDGNVFALKVTLDTEVPALKEQLTTLSNIPATQQRLIYKGKVLQDNKDLAFYNIEDGTTLHLAERPPDAGNQPPAQPIPQQQPSMAPGGQLPPGAQRIFIGNMPDAGDINATISNVLRSLAGPNQVVMGTPMPAPNPLLVDRNIGLSFSNVNTPPTPQQAQQQQQQPPPAATEPVPAAPVRMVQALTGASQSLSRMVERTNQLAETLGNEAALTTAQERQAEQTRINELAAAYQRLSGACNNMSRYLQSYQMGTTPGSSVLANLTAQISQISVTQYPMVPGQQPRAGQPQQPQAGAIPTVQINAQANPADPLGNIVSSVLNMFGGAAAPGAPGANPAAAAQQGANPLQSMFQDFRFLFSGVPSQMVQGHRNIRNVFVHDFLQDDTSPEAIDRYVAEFTESLLPMFDSSILPPEVVQRLIPGQDLIGKISSIVEEHLRKLFDIILTEPSESYEIPSITNQWTSKFVREVIDGIASCTTGGTEDAFLVVSRFIQQSVGSINPLLTTFVPTATQYVRNAYNASVQQEPPHL